MPDFPSVNSPVSVTPANPLGYRDPLNIVPPGYVRTGDGRIVPAQTPESVMVNRSRKKFLLALLYWQDDVERVDALANLIADLERVNNPDVDILLFGRWDCPVGLQYSTIENLRRKFANVHIMTDGGNYARGFPWAANVMWEELVGRMSTPTWADKYRCFLNLEWDCVPTRPGWLGELGREFDQATIEGRAVIGARQINPAVHINGVAVYASDIGKRVNGSIDGSCPPEDAYDVYYASKILPLALNTPKIKSDYHRATISPDELFASPAALYHGVRDMSAMSAVRDEHINHVPRSQQAFVRSNVFAYRRKITGIDSQEVDEQIENWRKGWLSAGWNPIVLGERVATQHPQYMEVMARVASFPTTGNIEHVNAKFERWLALAVQGGGLLTEFDVLPRMDFSPDKLQTGSGVQWLSGASSSALLAYADMAGFEAFLASLMAYAPAADAKAVSDTTILENGFDGLSKPLDIVQDYGANGWRNAKCVHFHAKAVNKSLPGVAPSRAMTSYLRNE
jgi:hypothetical protein